MNLLYDLILMVYADDVVDQHEIEFCEEAVKQFGMKKQLVHGFLAEFERGTPPPPDEWEEIKKEAKENFMLIVQLSVEKLDVTYPVSEECRVDEQIEMW